MLESTCHKFSHFVTLTYKEETVPPELSRDDASKFLHYFRKKFGSFRFFLVGEYGEISGRPHFHAIIYTHKDAAAVSEACEVSWGRKFGFFSVGHSFESAVAHYCSGYVTKKLNDCEDGREKEFIRVSTRPSIGSLAIPSIEYSLKKNNWFEEHVDVPISVNIGGKSWPLGRHLRKELRILFGIHDSFGILGNAPEGDPVAEEKQSEIEILYDAYRSDCERSGSHSSLDLFAGLYGQIQDGKRRRF